jgi:hypothetical protein
MGRFHEHYCCVCGVHPEDMILLDGSWRELLVESAKQCTVVLEDVRLCFNVASMKVTLG